MFADLPQKPFKRRRSLITWAFWRGSSSHLNELSVGAARGCLFGQPLGAICIEATLPKPVMVSPCPRPYDLSDFSVMYLQARRKDTV